MEYEAYPEYYINESWYFLWSSYMEMKQLHLYTYVPTI